MNASTFLTLLVVATAYHYIRRDGIRKVGVGQTCNQDVASSSDPDCNEPGSFVPRAAAITGRQLSDRLSDPKS